MKSNIQTVRQSKNSKNTKIIPFLTSSRDKKFKVGYKTQLSNSKQCMAIHNHISTLMTGVFLMMCCFMVKANQASLRYDPSGSSNWLPYYINNAHNPGIVGELLPIILEHANIYGVEVTLPPKRTLQAIERGDLDFDIISPSWFADHDVGEQFVLSKPLFKVNEHYIYLPGTKFSHRNVAKQPIGTVRGYLYHNENQLIRQDHPSEKQLIIALQRKRVNYAICGDLPALYWSKKLGLTVELGPLHSSGFLHLRLRKEHQALLPQINSAIDWVKQQGLINSILDKYSPIDTTDNF